MMRHTLATTLIPNQTTVGAYVIIVAKLSKPDVDARNNPWSIDCNCHDSHCDSLEYKLGAVLSNALLDRLTTRHADMYIDRQANNWSIWYLFSQLGIHPTI
jgi:hypothetical protein